MGWRTSPLTRIASLYGDLCVRFPRRGFLTGKGRYLISIATVVAALAPDAVPTAHAQTELAFPPMLTQPAASAATTTAAPAQATRPSQSGTLDLTQAYERMLLNDPQVRAASAALAAGRDAGNIARAALLPQASINYLRNRTSQTEYYDSTTAGQQSVDYRYFGRRAGLTIEQT